MARKAFKRNWIETKEYQISLYAQPQIHMISDVSSTKTENGNMLMIAAIPLIEKNHKFLGYNGEFLAYVGAISHSEKYNDPFFDSPRQIDHIADIILYDGSYYTEAATSPWTGESYFADKKIVIYRLPDNVQVSVQNLMDGVVANG